MISLIVALAKNNVIGNNGVMPWKIKDEQKRFKELTIGKTIIMGRKSFKFFEYLCTPLSEIFGRWCAFLRIIRFTKMLNSYGYESLICIF